MTRPAPGARAARIARRMAEIEPFHVMALLARARVLEAQGRSIIHMEIGEPDFPTPEPILRAGIRALEKGELYYTPTPGLPQLRQAISGFYRARYGVDVSPSRIIVTTGSSAALLLACAVLLDPGDEVLLADPGYPANRHFVRVVEGVPRALPVDAATDYQLAPDHLERGWGPRTVAALVASPSNPTGTLISTERLSAMAEIARAKGGTLIVDEIYHGLVYGDDYTTALALADDVIVINSFSKYFNMTGWRLGWMVAPEHYVGELDKLAQNLYLAAPTPAQYAALAAFEPETLAILATRTRELKARRDYLVPALRGLGFDIPVTPQGAFYIYAGCGKLTKDSFAFARGLLEEAGVAITPGIDFGRNAPERHVRFAYTSPIERLQEGVRRISQFLGN
ncbi:MAG: aminotransferase [Betaproteobacteria bacterium RIFCSPLOWO2_02_FULL_67_26]|nr:MAG: aminotransferase [Betaproteobacteria bacterium RIFCSPLOWO2_02_FULL_67_26]